jgi:hypothetical protein
VLISLPASRAQHCLKRHICDAVDVALPNIELLQSTFFGGNSRNVSIPPKSSCHRNESQAVQLLSHLWHVAVVVGAAAEQSAVSAGFAANNLIYGTCFASLHALAWGIPAEAKDAQQLQSASTPAVCFFCLQHILSYSCLQRSVLLVCHEMSLATK